MNRIDEKTSITLGFKALGGLGTALVLGVWTLAMFVGGIQTDIHDLKRDMSLVKHKLKIDNDTPVAQGSTGLIDEAEASKR